MPLNEGFARLHQVSAGALAIATVVARSADAVIDPLFGWISDHTHTRYGRRKPFIAVSVPINAICYYLLFTPPENISAVAASYWFCFFFFAYLSVPLALPLFALGPELTTDNTERVSMFMYAEFFDKVGVIVASILPSALLVWTHGNYREAFAGTALVISVVSVIAFCILLYFVPEPPETSRKHASTSSWTSHLVPGIRRSWRNKPFRILVTAATIGAVSHSITNVLIAYFVAEVLKVPDSDVWLS